MSKQKIKKSLKKKLLKFSELVLVFLFTTFMIIIMAFYYDELGTIPTTILIIAAVALFLPKFLRRNFGTDKMKDIEAVKGIDFQNSIGSFLWTRVDETGFFPYREFVTHFCRPKLMKKQLQGKVYYIDFKAKCLIATIQLLYGTLFLFLFIKIGKINNPLIAIFAILSVTIISIKSCDKTRNFIIRKSAKILTKI